MKLKGSCHCGAVTFSVTSQTPYPYMRCYCTICRKTAGSGGFAINLGADAETLKIVGEENITVYQAELDGETSPARRNFCNVCGSALWLFDPRWPELLHPHASAIDTKLPRPPAFADIMQASAAPWVEFHPGENVDEFDDYPDQSIADWHKSRGLGG